MTQSRKSRECINITKKYKKLTKVNKEIIDYYLKDIQINKDDLMDVHYSFKYLFDNRNEKSLYDFIKRNNLNKYKDESIHYLTHLLNDERHQKRIEREPFYEQLCEVLDVSFEELCFGSPEYFKLKENYNPPVLIDGMKPIREISPTLMKQIIIQNNDGFFMYKIKQLSKKDRDFLEKMIDSMLYIQENIDRYIYEDDLYEYIE